MGHIGEFILLFVLANLPFLSDRLFLLFRMAKGKTVLLRGMELVLYYFLAGALLGGREIAENGSRYPQGWEFFAITLCLFAVFAYPGFVYRHLRLHDLKA